MMWEDSAWPWGDVGIPVLGKEVLVVSMKVVGEEGSQGLGFCSCEVGVTMLPAWGAVVWGEVAPRHWCAVTAAADVTKKGRVVLAGRSAPASLSQSRC